MSEWNGCYDEGWKGLIVDESFAHPAKMSYALAARIYDHAFKASWIKPGDTVVDPFGGIGGTAIHAACHGLRWIGCEIEPKFAGLADQNFAMWRDKWGSLPEWVQPTIHCGDSRRLAEILGFAECLVSSPPYSSGEKGHPSLGSVNNDDWGTDGRDISRRRGKTGEYGEAIGQLGSMREGDFAAVVSSPPFSGTEQPCASQTKSLKDYHAFTRGNGTKRDGTLTEGTPGQLGAMVVGSPPFEASLATNVHTIADIPGIENHGHRKAGQIFPSEVKQEYGCEQGNIGNQSGETFWTAARDIVAQCHMILRPGGHAIWVCKDFVRKGKRVPFSDQWQALCESIGFRPVCRHRAMLVKTGATQKLLDGGTHTTTRERKSFFRRLAEKKGSPRIDWEDVICMVR